MAQIDKLVFWSKPFAKQLAVKIKKWVWADMRKGILQGKQDTYRPGKTKPKSGEISWYVKYKNNYMNRFTDRGGKAIGTKISPYQGVSIKSNWTKSVNMYLSGQLISGLEYLKSDRVSLWMTYSPQDRDKIKGNEEMGRYVRGLNKKNIEKVKKAIIKEFNKNKKKLKDITIRVGR